MAKFYVTKRVIADYELVIEADNEDEIYDLVAEGVDWVFVANDDEGLVIEPVIAK